MLLDKLISAPPEVQEQCMVVMRGILTGRSPDERDELLAEVRAAEEKGRQSSAGTRRHLGVL